MGKKLIKLHTVEGQEIAVCAADYIIVNECDHRAMYDDQIDYRDDDETGICVTESLDRIINQNND